MDTELSRARRFESVLKPRIKEAIIPFELIEYSKIVSKALLIERTQLATQEEIKARQGSNNRDELNGSSWKQYEEEVWG